MRVNLTGRVIDSWKGTNPNYPDTRVTLMDLSNGQASTGQVDLNVPAELVSLVPMDAKVTIDGDVVVRKTKIGLQLTLAKDAKIVTAK